MFAARSRRLLLGATTVALVALGACGDDSSSSATTAAVPTSASAATTEGAATSTTTGSDQSAAETYCTDKGGKLVVRTATWNTNADESDYLQLANTLTFCEFESTDSTGNTTRISVDLTTLYSEEPTLASVAYLSEVKPTLPNPPGPNPADYSCSVDLSASAAFGGGAAGSGWVNNDEPVFKVMDECVFPDMSAIDAFGIWYHATGAIRGADLAPLFRYQPGDELPAIFPSGPGR